MASSHEGNSRMFEKLSLKLRIVLGKIIMKVLLTPQLKKRFERVIYLYETVQIKNERDMLDQKQEVSRLNFKHYLPDTDKRIERLRQVINKRPVAIILHGPSITELERRIIELQDCDICYFGLNYFTIPEKDILQKINRTYSIIMVSGIPRPGDHIDMDDAINFLEREDNNVFISETDSIRPLEMTHGIRLDEFIKKYDKKLMFFTGTSVTFITIGNGLLLPVPSIEYPLHFLRQSSASMLLSLALIGEAPMVVVFGGDGGRINPEKLYYKDSGSKLAESVLEESLAFETKLFNLTMPLMIEKIYKIYNLRPIDIVNCSPQSHYTPLRKLSYDETFALLKSFKKGIA
jgi:hypothetical protein